MGYKEIGLAEAVEAIILGKKVYSFHRIMKDASVEDLYEAKGFLVEVQNKVDPKLTKEKKQNWGPKKEPAKVDHDKICALYKAKWPITKIADEMKCSEQTIRNHLDKEGLRK